MAAAKTALTVPSNLLEEAGHAAEEGTAPSLSAYATSALETCGHRRTLDELLRDLDEELGEIDPAVQDRATNEPDHIEGRGGSRDLGCGCSARYLGAASTRTGSPRR